MVGRKLGVLGCVLLSSACMGTMQQTAADDAFPDETIGGPQAPAPAIDDGQDPVVTLREPLRGTTLPGEQIRFAGVVTDANPSHLLIEDQRVELLPSGEFDTVLTFPAGAHRVHVVGVDASGREGEAVTSFLNGQLGDPGGQIEEAFALDVADAAVGDISSALATMLTQQDFSSTLVQSNPVYDENSIEVNVVNETHGNVDVNIVPVAGALQITASVSGLVVNLRGRVPLLGGVDGEVHAGMVTLSGTLALSALDGVAQASVLSSQVNVSGFGINVEHVPGFVEDLVEDRVEDAVKEAVQNAIVDAVPELVTGALGSLGEGTAIELNEQTLLMSMDVDDLAVAPTGLHASASFAVEAMTPLPERANAGFLATPRGNAPVPPSPLSLSIALDALNAAFTEVWASGAVDLDLDPAAAEDALGLPLNAGSVALLVPGLPRVAAAADPVGVTLTPILAPVISGNAEGQATIDIVDLEVVLATDTDLTVANLSVGLSVAVDPHVEDGELKLGVSQAEVEVSFVGEPPPNARLDNLAELLEELLVTQLDELLPSVLPSLWGFELVPSHVSATNGYLTLGITPQVATM